MFRLLFTNNLHLDEAVLIHLLDVLGYRKLLLQACELVQQIPGELGSESSFWNILPSSLASSNRKTLQSGRTSSWWPTPGTSSWTKPPIPSSTGGWSQDGVISLVQSTRGVTSHTTLHGGRHTPPHTSITLAYTQPSWHSSGRWWRRCPITGLIEERCLLELVVTIRLVPGRV